MTNELKQEMTERFNSAYGEEVKIGLREALRKVYIDGGEHGYQYAIEKACEWLRENIYHRVYECGDRLGYPTADFIKDFRNAMEE